jgi:hypothetical protein
LTNLLLILRETDEWLGPLCHLLQINFSNKERIRYICIFYLYPSTDTALRKLQEYHTHEAEEDIEGEEDRA